MLDMAQSRRTIIEQNDVDLLLKIADAIGEEKSVFDNEPSSSGSLSDLSDLIDIWHRIVDPNDRRVLMTLARNLVQHDYST